VDLEVRTGGEAIAAIESFLVAANPMGWAGAVQTLTQELRVLRRAGRPPDALAGRWKLDDEGGTRCRAAHRHDPAECVDSISKAEKS
jgi:hypothetical protein